MGHDMETHRDNEVEAGIIQGFCHVGKPKQVAISCWSLFSNPIPYIYKDSRTVLLVSTEALLCYIFDRTRTFLLRVCKGSAGSDVVHSCLLVPQHARGWEGGLLNP